MKKPAHVIAAITLMLFTVSASAEMTGKFIGVWKAKPNANATYTISKDGDNYKLQIQDRNTGTHEYSAVEDKGQFYQILNGVKRPMFTYVDENNIKYTTIVGKNIPYLKKQK